MNSRPTIPRQAGFTLIELIGVMAIIAVLAAVLAPSITDGIDRAYAATEDENLSVLMGALEQHILVNKHIPRQTQAQWTAAVSAHAGLAASEVELNARGYRRRLYVDPQFFTTSEATFPGYTQTAGLASRPNSPRLMLVSDLSRNAPNPPSSAAAFAAIWDQSAGATVVEADKVKVERLNLSGHFHRVLLINSNVQQPSFALESGSPVAVPAALAGADGMMTRYVLEASRLSVFFSPYPAGSMNTSTIVKGDVSMHYSTDGSNWFWERS